MLLLPLLLVFSVQSIIAIQRSPEDELLLVQVVIRHADRAGMSAYATDASKEVYFRGLGELSDEGIDNAYKQGSDYRRRYVETGFIDDRMVPTEIRIRSSGVPRVLMSAASFTAALFNQTEGGLSRVPPIFTKETGEDPLLVPPLDCLDGWDDVVEKYSLNTPENAETRTKRDRNPLKSARKYNAALKVLFASYIPDDCKMVSPELLEPIVAELANSGINLPPAWVPCAQNGAKKLMFKYMEILSGAGQEFNLLRLQRTAGMLTGRLIDNMRNMLNCTEDCAEPKLRVYYTHDVNVLATAFIFDIIDMFQGKTPAFSSSIVFELRNGTEGPYVNIFLKNGHEAAFVESDRCLKDCSIDAVEKLTAAYTIREPASCILSLDELNTTTTKQSSSTSPYSTTTKAGQTLHSSLALLCPLLAVFLRF